jgi:hypothetical protein
MPRIIFMAGTIIASSIGFALAGLVLREAIKNSRPRRSAKPLHSELFADPVGVFDSRTWDIAVRGYDSPELRHDDTLARQRLSGSNRGVQ